MSESSSVDAPPMPLARWNRLATWIADPSQRPTIEAFQVRFLIAATALGFAIALFSLVLALAMGRPVDACWDAAYAAGVIALLVPLRLGVSPRTLVWPHIALLASFLLAVSVGDSALHPEQLGWFVLIPLITRLLLGVDTRYSKRNLLAHQLGGAAVALAGPMLCIALVRTGHTFHQPDGGVDGVAAILEFVELSAAVLGVVWIFYGLRRTAEAELAQLRGLLPICAWCKKIRNDAHEWQRVEDYIGQRTAAVFSHGMCPTCEAQHFPDEDRH